LERALILLMEKEPAQGRSSPARASFAVVMALGYKRYTKGRGCFQKKSGRFCSAPLAFKQSNPPRSLRPGWNWEEMDFDRLLENSCGYFPGDLRRLSSAGQNRICAAL